MSQQPEQIPGFSHCDQHGAYLFYCTGCLEQDAQAVQARINEYQQAAGLFIGQLQRDLQTLTQHFERLLK